MGSNNRGNAWLWIVGLTIVLAFVSIGLTHLLGEYWQLPLGDRFSLAQLIVAMILIPLAVVAFWEARNALLRAAATPNLRFAFLGEDGLLHDEYLLVLPEGGGHANRVTFAVENTGQAVAVWWQVTFDLPVALMETFRAGEGNVNVGARQVPVMMDTVGDVERRVAQSVGTIGLFPGPPVQVAIMEVQFDVFAGAEFDSEYLVRYEVLTDRSAAQEGEIPLRVQVPGADAA